MRTFWCLFKREIKACFLSPIAFVVLFFFWVLMGLNFFWVMWQLANGVSVVDASKMMLGLISTTLPVMVPLVTMRLFAEERKLGTLEGVLTTSVRVPELVLSKFFGALVFYAVLWIPIFFYAFLQHRMSKASGIGVSFPDNGALWAGVLGVMLVGALYISIGILMSSLTSNQIIAAISGFALLCGSLVMFSLMAYTAQSETAKLLGAYYSSYAHILDFARGSVDSRFVVLYLSGAAWFLFATVKVIEVKRV